MIQRVCFFAIAAAILFSQSLRAQSGASPAPTPPYLGTIPDHTAWTVTVQPKTKPPEPPDGQAAKSPRVNLWNPTLESVAGLKVGKTLKLVYSWVGNIKTETYAVDGMVFKSSSAKYPEDVLILNPASPTTAVPRFDKSDFPEYAWAGPETYIQTVREGAVQCNVYELVASNGSLEGLSPEQQKAQREVLAKISPVKLWVAADSGLPVKYDDGTNILTYRFTSVPGAKMDISAPFAKVIDAFQAQRNPR